MSAARVVVITGAAGGIGRAITRRAAEDGWHVVLGDISAEGLESVAGELADAERGVDLLRTDVAEESDVDALADVAASRGTLTAWVNAAGVIHRAPLLDITVADWDRMMAVNARSCFLGVRAAASRMPETGGSIVNMASISSVISLPNTAHYGAAKGAVASLTRHAALELGPRGVRVNAIAPGTIRTPMTVDRLAAPGQEERTLGRIPLGRIGEPKDIASVVSFLIGDDSRYMSGATVHVDGGWYAT